MKHLEVAHLREFIEQKLQELLADNHTRTSFVERLQRIINEYNSGGRTTEQSFEDLNIFKDDMTQEEQRHIVEGLTEAELELFDLLYKEKLTANERTAVKNAARDLLRNLNSLWRKNGSGTKIARSRNRLKGRLKVSWIKICRKVTRSLFS